MTWRFWRRADATPTPSDAYDSLAAWQARDMARFVARHQEAAKLQASPPARIDALCGTCASARRFAPLSPVDLREGLACPRCRLNARQRAALGLLRDRVPARDARIYATEQASPVYVWLRSRYPNATGSEFHVAPERATQLSLWLARQGIREPIHDMDATALPQADASLDAILSLDVLEHVPDYEQALREFARTLKPGGVLVLTAPFVVHTAKTLVRARLRPDGSVEHIEPEEIHGDPLSGGVLCFYHFGWDLLDAARAAGFAQAQWHHTWAPEQALFGMWTLVAGKA